MAQQVLPRACDACGSRYQPARVTSRYCSDRCRKRAQRAKLSTPRVRPDDVTVDRPACTGSTLGPIAAAVLEELRLADKHGTALGQQCLYLAGRVDAGQAESGSALSALNRELRATRAEALATVQPAGDALDEMARKREERLARAARG